VATARYPIEMINGVPVVTAPEEIDVSNADWLRVIPLEAATRRQARFVVDMTGTQFCGSAGVGVLVGAHNRALAERGEMRLVIPASCLVRRVLEITGLDRLIPSFPDLDQALEPAPAATPPRPRRPRKRPKPGMRPRADRPPPDPASGTSPA
jgi:anti-sigma B factor antagonist